MLQTPHILAYRHHSFKKIEKILKNTSVFVAVFLLLVKGVIPIILKTITNKEETAMKYG
jgi:hypothetical protein